jgi:hypothetical protein
MERTTMTAHKEKPTITPERVEWFAHYYAENLAWGVFHVSLDDGNYELGAADGATWNELARAWGPPYRIGDDWPEDVREHAAWFDTLTPSQRRRLRDKATTRRGALSGEARKQWRERAVYTVTHVDQRHGTITLECK